MKFEELLDDLREKTLHDNIIKWHFSHLLILIRVIIRKDKQLWQDIRWLLTQTHINVADAVKRTGSQEHGTIIWLQLME